LAFLSIATGFCKQIPGFPLRMRYRGETTVKAAAAPIETVHLPMRPEDARLDLTS
jgi:hypothetical protein